MNENLKRIVYAILIFFLFAQVVIAKENQKSGSALHVDSALSKNAMDKFRIIEFDRNPVSGTYEFRNVDFGNGGVTGFVANAMASYIPSGWIEIRIDSPNGKKIGICLISQRDGGKNWYIAKTGIYHVEGVHSVFLVFLGAADNGYSPQIEWFSFTKDEPQDLLIAGNLLLPPQVPYLGPLENNFFGNGIAGAGGDTQGNWDYLVGPAYTMESYINEEKITISLNGKDYPLDAEIKRARGTGIFYSKLNIQNINFFLVDFALQNTPFVTRGVFVKNSSGIPIKLVLKTTIKLSPHSLLNQSFNEKSVSSNKIGNGLHLIMGEKYGMTIAASDPLSICAPLDNGYCLKTKEITLQPGEKYQMGIYHFAHMANDDIEEIRAKIYGRNVEKDIELCILNWTGWLSEGISLQKIADLRVRDIVEANTIMIKMQQGVDGGIMATPRFYKTSFIRDTHNALRGLMAAGHTEEARTFMLWVHHKFKILQAKGQFAIPNAGDIGGDGTFAGYGNEENWAAETPALYMLVAENYFKRTNDIKTLQYIDESLRYAMKCQLDCAEKNEWMLPFNGDETESGGSGIKLWDSAGKWSMPSVLFCSSSLKFFIHYLEEINEKEYLNEYKEKLKLVENSLYSNFWNEEKGMYDWYRGENGERPKLPISNYTLMPIYFHCTANKPQLAAKSAEQMKQYVTERVFLPVQPGALHGDFCGHSLGYLLYALTELDDPLKDSIYDSLLFGGTVGCWGMWSESYTADGVSYGPSGGLQYWDTQSSPMHNMRPFESGTNLDAIINYLKLDK